MKRKNIFKSALIPTAVALSFFSPPSIAVDTSSPSAKKLISNVIQHGKVRVIVDLTPPELPSSVASMSGKTHDKALSVAIAQIQQNVLDRMVGKGEKIDNPTKFRYTPQMAFAVTKKGLNALKSDPNVVQIHEDSLHQGSVGNSVPNIFPSYQTSPYSGEGWTVAILDSGVDTSHSAFGNRVVYEACFSANSTGSNGIPFNNYYSLCPNGETEATGEGSGINCHNRLEELKTELGKEEDEEGTSCGHGTAVASVAVGDFGDMQGVAKDAGLMVLQVFTAVDNDNTIGAFAFSSDIMKGLERVYELRDTHHVASINLSISGEGEIATTDQCRNALGPNDEDYDALRPGIELLRQAGIATVIASGNDNFSNAVGGIACINSAITVGAVDNTDDLYAFTNRGLLLDLYAPGVGIVTANAGGGLAEPTQGTSFAAPHVAGAWAVMKQRKPDATVDEIENAFKTTGLSITTGGNVTRQRINIDEALNMLSDDPGTGMSPEIEDACQQGHFVDGSLKEGDAVCIPNFANGGQFQSEIYVPNDKAGSTMEIILRHGTGNGNLLHRHDNRPTRTVFDHISDNSGNEERILVENVQERWNYIHVRADTEFSDVTLLVRFVEGSTPPLTRSPVTSDIQIDDACQQGQTPVGNVELFAGSVVCLQDVSNRGYRQMALYVTDDKVGSTLEILLSHGFGNGSLLHRYDSRPNGGIFDHISNNSGNEERILVDNVKGGWNYIHVDGDTAFSGVTLLPRYVVTDSNVPGNTSSPSSEPVINPVAEGWVNMSVEEVKGITLSAANSLLENIPNVSLDPIILKNIPNSNAPIILFERGSNNEYQVRVDISDAFWAQLVYQFSHEYMHILSNYGGTVNDANQWFEEALSETASMQAVKRLSVVWQTDAPFPYMQSYAPSLENYFNNLINEEHRYLSQPGDNIADWYQREQESLRTESVSLPAQRKKIEVVGTKIYQFFAESPDRWRAVRYLNIDNANNQISLEQYLNDWRRSLPDDLKYVAETISSWFGY